MISPLPATLYFDMIFTATYLVEPAGGDEQQFPGKLVKFQHRRLGEIRIRIGLVVRIYMAA